MTSRTTALLCLAAAAFPLIESASLLSLLRNEPKHKQQTAATPVIELDELNSVFRENARAYVEGLLSNCADLTVLMIFENPSLTPCFCFLYLKNSFTFNWNDQSLSFSMSFSMPMIPPTPSPTTTSVKNQPSASASSQPRSRSCCGAAN